MAAGAGTAPGAAHARVPDHRNEGAEALVRVLITGTAGFIGNALALRPLDRGDEVLGLDNLNDYYDVQLKRDRLQRIGGHRNYTDLRAELEDTAAVDRAFAGFKPQRVVNLAAQAGVRYSLT